MSGTNTQSNDRHRKTKAQLIEELEELERRLGAGDAAATEPGQPAEARSLLLDAIEHLAEGVALFDAEDRLVLCNRKYVSAFAPELEDGFESGMGFEDLVRIATERNYFATDDHSAEDVIHQRLEAHRSRHARHEVRLADGSWVSFQSYTAPGGGTVLLRLDITDLKRAEERLRESEERYRSFVDTANDAIISIDDDARIIAWNKGAERIFGYTEEDMVGATLDQLMPGDLYGLHVAGVQRASVDGEHKYAEKSVELRGLRKDGSDFPLELSLSHWSVEDKIFFSVIIRDITEKKEEAEALQRAKEDNERLLLKVLPSQIVIRMQQGEATIADRFDEATVLFSDLVGFTKLSARLSPKQLVDNLNDLFSRFDNLADRLGVEKVKTIGDAYVAVAGVPEARPDHAAAMADMALGMIEAVDEFNAVLDPKFQLRVGLQTGPVAAGIIGKHRFLYDIWGDTVNMASRFESYSEPGRIHMSTEVARILEPDFDVESRGIMDIRGKGAVPTYFLNGRK